MVGSLSDLMVTISGNATGLKAALGEAETSTTGFASKLGGVGSIAAAGLGGAAVAIGAFALKANADVAGAYKSIEKQTGDTGASLNILKGSFNTVFGDFPISASDAATAVSTVSDRIRDMQNGVPPTQAVVTSLTSAFEEFATVTGTSVATDTDQLMKTFAQFHEPASDMAASLNNITQASQYTHIPVSQLQGDMVKAGPTFAAAGLGVDQMTASVAQMDSAGVKSRTAISGLNTGMAALEKQGMTGKQAFTELTEELDKYATTGVKTGEVAKLSGTALTQLTAAAKSGAFDFDTLTGKMYTNSGAMEKSYEDTLTFSQKLDIFKNKLELAFAPLGGSIMTLLTNFLSMITPILPVITALVTAFTSMPMPIQMVVMAGAALVGGLGALNLVLGKFGMSIKSLPGDIEKLIPQIKGLASSMSSIPSKIVSLGGGGGAAAGEGAAGGEAAAAGEGTALSGVLASLAPLLLPVVAIVAAISAGFIVLYATSSTFRDMISGVVTTLQNVLSWVTQIGSALMSGNFSKAGDLLKQGFEGAINSIKNFDFGAWAGKMVTSFEESFTTISSLLGGIGSTIMSTLGSIDWGGAFYGILTAIDNILTQAMNFDPTTLVNQIVDAIGHVFDSLFGGSSGGTAGATASTGLSNGLSKGMEKAGPDILGKLGDVFLKLLALLPVIFVKVGVALAAALEKVDWGSVFNKMISGPLMAAIAGALGGLGGAAGGALSGIGDALTKSISGFGQALYDVVVNVFQFPLKFYQQLFNLARTWMGGIGKWMYDAIMNLFQFDVKFYTQLMNQAKNFMGGMGKWFYDAIITMFNLDTKLYTAVINAFVGFGRDLWDLISTLGTQLWTVISTALGTFGTWMWGMLSPLPGKLWDAIQTALGTFGTWLNSLMTVGAAMWSQIESAVGGFGTWLIAQVSGIGGSIWSSISGAVSGFGADLIGQLSSLGATILSAVTTGAAGFGPALVSAANTAATTIETAITNLFNSISIPIQVTLPSFSYGGVTIGGQSLGGTIKLAGGGVVSAVPGGVLALIGEGRGGEAVVPESMWWGVNPAVLNALPKFGGGGVIGSVSTSAVTQPSGSAKNENVYYNLSVNVQDSEAVTQAVFAAIRTLENYHHL